MMSTDYICGCGFWNCTLCPTVGTNQEDAAYSDVTIYPTAKIIGREHLKIGSHVVVDDNVFLSVGPGSSIGSYTHIACGASVLGQGKFVLGDFASIAAGARLYSAGDDLRGGALINPTVPARYRNAYRVPVIVGKHAVVATGAVVMAGCTLEEGSILGALSYLKPGSVIPAYEVWVGCPARKIGMRDKEGVQRREKELLSEAAESQ